MKTISEIRLENLRLLIDEFGTQDAVAERAATSPVYLSQLLNAAVDVKTGRVRQIGDPLARKLEAGCGKEVGWMDNIHDAPAADLYASQTIIPLTAANNDTPAYYWPFSMSARKFQDLADADTLEAINSLMGTLIKQREKAQVDQPPQKAAG